MTLAPHNLKVYRDILRLIWRYGNREVLQSIGFHKHLDDADSDHAAVEVDAQAEQLTHDLEQLGPTYVKIGQVLSTQLTILPTRYKEALARLQDDVKPAPFPEIQKVLEHELGSPILSTFAHLDTVPSGAGSLAQVHRAVTLDGMQVAVKVQRPGAKEQIEQDFEALAHVAGTLDTLTSGRYHFADVLEHTRTTLMRELDFRMEASNLTTIGGLLKDDELIVIPRPILALTSERVLTMEYLEGIKVTSLTPRQVDELDGQELAEHLFEAYLNQILVHGIFHADPHPGNVLVDDRGRLILLDLGMVGHVAPRMRELLTQLVLAITDGRGDQVADIATRIGEPDRNFDHMRFTRRISDLVMERYRSSVEGLGIGNVVLDISAICAEDRVSIPPTLTMIGKTLLNLDQIAHAICPKFNPRKSIQRNAQSILSKQFRRSLTRTRFMDAAIEISRLLEDAPRRLNKLLDMLSRHDRGFKIDAIDEERLISGFEKIANRITYGLIVASLYLAGAIIMSGDLAGPRMGGVPLLSAVAFILAAAGTVLILMGMYVNSGPKK